MSTAHTGAASAPDSATLGLRPATLPALRDVDTFDDASAVAAEAPTTRFAAELAAMTIEAAA